GKELVGRGYRGHNVLDQTTFQLAQHGYDINTLSIVNTLIHTFTPATVLEMIVGTNWSEQDVYALTQADRDALDYAIQLPSHVPLFQGPNPAPVLPNLTFAGTNALPGTAS